MSTILKNIVRFTGLVVGVPVALPHRLNVNGIPTTPKTVEPDTGGFTITANATNVTVTRTADGAANVDVLVEFWHSIEAVVPLVPPPGGLVGLTPWIQQPGAGGGGGGGGSPASDVLTFRPGSGLSGPNVFDDFNALYAQFNTLRAAAQNSGKFKIVIDDQDIGGPGSTVVLDSGPGNITYDFQYATLVGVHEDANVLLDIQDGGGETDSLTITNALWFEGLTIRATGQDTAFTALANQTFTLTRTTFLGGGGQFVLDILNGAPGCILHLNDESTIERNGVFPAGNAPIRVNGVLVTVHMNGANCRVNANAFVSGGGGQLTPIINSSSARFDFDQADVGGVVNAQMSTAAGYWTYGAPFTVTNPNGVLSATRGTIIVDQATGLQWVNTDGATAWETLSASVAPSPSRVFEYFTDFIRADGKFTEDLGNPSTGWANTGPGSMRIARISTNGANEGALWEVGDVTNFGNFLWVNSPVQANGSKLTVEWGGSIADLSPNAGADFTSRFVAGNLLSSSVVGGNGNGFGFSLGLAQNGNANIWGFLDDATKVDLGVLNDFNSHVYKVVYTIGTGVQWFIDNVLLGTFVGVPSANGLSINVGFNMRTPAANAGAPGMELDFLKINYDYVRY